MLDLSKMGKAAKYLQISLANKINQLIILEEKYTELIDKQKNFEDLLDKIGVKETYEDIYNFIEELYYFKVNNKCNCNCKLVKETSNFIENDIIDDKNIENINTKYTPC